jgi:exodeoxyribonuclease VII large subunit
VQLVLYPAIVQGEAAAPSIVRGLEALDQTDVDVIIVGRGGGSIEDLWAFNEESVARAIFQCRHPVISAVGHETDFTIADFVADLRAPTPSAAAELAVYEIEALDQAMDDMKDRLRLQLSHKIQQARSSEKACRLRFRYLHPKVQLQTKRQIAADFDTQFRTMIERKIKEYKYRLGMQAEILHGRSPALKFTQGYSYAMNADGKNVRSIFDVSTGDSVSIAVQDGWIETRVTGCREEQIHDRTAESTE